MYFRLECINGLFFEHSCLNNFLHYYKPANSGEEMSKQESIPFPSEVVNLQPDEKTTEEDPAAEGFTEQPTVEPMTAHSPLETEVITNPKDH